MLENKKVIGIVCECNPFHKGHKRLIRAAKSEGQIVIAVMSGNFVQRGEPSVYDKYKKTKKLLSNGIDLVIEIPVEYVMSSAHYYAMGAVSILDKLGFVDNIIFGSKIADIEKLTKISKLNDKKVKDYIKEGLSYPKALEKTYGVKLSPNDILGVEYIKAINELNSNIKPLCIKRKADLPTATELRKKIKTKINTDSFSDILTYKIFENKENGLCDVYTLTKDLSNAITNTYNIKLRFEKRAKLLNTKNRTLSNIKRCFFNIIFNITKKQVDINDYGKKVPYIRILGIKKETMPLLKKLKVPYLLSFANHSYKDFVNKFSKKILDNPSLKTNIYASNLYYLMKGEKASESTKPLVIL